MRKSELLKAVPSELPEDNYARIITADKKRVLMLILPEWQVTNSCFGARTGVIHFTWDEGWLSYYPSDKEWSRQTLATIYFNSYVLKTGFDDEGMEAIGDFCNTGYRHIDKIEQYESEISYRKHERALDNKQKRIDAFMKNVPALPKDFKRFCLRTLEKADAEKAHIKLYQPYTYEHTVSGIKFYEERYIERIFSVTNFNGSITRITELCRAYTKEVGGTWIRWYYGEKFGRYGKDQHFWDKKYDSVVNNLPRKHFVYDNLDTLGLPESEKATLRILDGECDPSIVLYKLRRNPQIEYIAKKGLIRLATDLVDNYGAKPIDISKAECEKLKKAGGGICAKQLLEVAPKINEKYLKDFCRIKDGYKAGLIIDLARAQNINHIYSLLLKTGGMTVANIKEYEDYLKMAQRLGNNPNDEIIYRNKRWHEFHDRYTEIISAQEAKVKNRKENSKYKEIKKDYHLNTSLFGWEDDDYIVVVPRNAGEINEEGRKQHHCVGAQSQYKEKMCERRSFIVFLRKKGEPKKPYYTIECDYTRVIQFYAAYDRQPDKEVVQKVLSKWMKQVKKNIRKMEKAVG